MAKGKGGKKGKGEATKPEWMSDELYALSQNPVDAAAAFKTPNSVCPRRVQAATFLWSMALSSAKVADVVNAGVVSIALSVLKAGGDECAAAALGLTYACTSAADEVGLGARESLVAGKGLPVLWALLSSSSLSPTAEECTCGLLRNLALDDGRRVQLLKSASAAEWSTLLRCTLASSPKGCALAAEALHVSLQDALSEGDVPPDPRAQEQGREAALQMRAAGALPTLLKVLDQPPPGLAADLLLAGGAARPSTADADAANEWPRARVTHAASLLRTLLTVLPAAELATARREVLASLTAVMGVLRRRDTAIEAKAAAAALLTILATPFVAPAGGNSAAPEADAAADAEVAAVGLKKVPDEECTQARAAMVKAGAIELLFALCTGVCPGTGPGGGPGTEGAPLAASPGGKKKKKAPAVPPEVEEAQRHAVAALRQLTQSYPEMCSTIANPVRILAPFLASKDERMRFDVNALLLTLSSAPAADGDEARATSVPTGTPSPAPVTAAAAAAPDAPSPSKSGLSAEDAAALPAYISGLGDVMTGRTERPDSTPPQRVPSGRHLFSRKSSARQRYERFYPGREGGEEEEEELSGRLSRARLIRSQMLAGPRS
mmetsp:Transcript_20518/g.66617  ORF Transcript_20518/g.66617 Transcript_20518/m.66617 type:complete len:608 (-) Transcript_20518:634-2457(-)